MRADTAVKGNAWVRPYSFQRFILACSLGARLLFRRNLRYPRILFFVKISLHSRILLVFPSIIDFYPCYPRILFFREN